MPEAGWLAFDVGTTGARAVLLTADGRVLRSAHPEYLVAPLFRPEEGQPR